MKTIFYSTHAFDQPFFEAAMPEGHTFTFVEEALNLSTAQRATGYEAVALFSNDDASAPVLEALASLGVRYIPLRTVGYDHVDLTAAARLGLRVANVPEYSPYAIAEHGVAMLMMLNRKLYEAQLLLQMQDFRLDSLVGFDLYQKTVGVVGTGKIGFAFARIMHGFGCRLLAYDPQPNPKAEQIGMRYVSLDTLLAESDVVSLNCPLNAHTRNLLDTPQFARMKKGAILINTARGGVVSTEALLEALETGHLGGACLDVYDREKGLFFYDHRTTTLTDQNYARLRSFKNVLITGHQAFLTREALQGITDATMRNLSEWGQKGIATNEVAA